MKDLEAIVVAPREAVSADIAEQVRETGGVARAAQDVPAALALCSDAPPDLVVLARGHGAEDAVWTRQALEALEAPEGAVAAPVLLVREELPRVLFASPDAGSWEARRVEREIDDRVRDRTRVLSRRSAELNRSNAELEAFAYVASHDLQEPLRMVTSFCELLQRRYADRLDPEADRWIGFAVDGARRMRFLINSLLAYSRAGRSELSWERVAVSDLLDDALANLKVRFEETGGHVSTGTLPEVLGDRSRLAQVFQNLLDNALKYRSEAPPRIHVDARRDGDEWELCVEDNGIGFDPQYTERIFQVLRRLHARDERGGGSGIGLPMVRRILERHGGSIRAESEPGRGSRFLFRLPALEAKELES